MPIHRYTIRMVGYLSRRCSLLSRLISIKHRLVCWIYLRFYKKNTTEILSGGPTYGDRSETFAFVQWFPPFIQCVIFLIMLTHFTTIATAVL